MHIDEFNDYIVVPSLNVAGLYSPCAANLLLGTAIIESNLNHVEQRGPGRAMGFFQIEEATYNDILRYINRYENGRLKEIVLSCAFYVCWPPAESLVHNMRWGCLVARLKYHMQKEALPEEDDAQALGNYYKKYYNTSKGSAEMSKIISVFESIVKS